MKRLFQDEQGSRSMARTLVCGHIIVAWVYIGTGGTNESVLAFLATLGVALAAWAGGPRVAQYLAPQIGKVAGALKRGLDDHRKDDEIG